MAAGPRGPAGLTGSPDGATAHLDADLRATAEILARAAATLDFRQPAAIMLVGILQLTPARTTPTGTVRTLLAAAAPGSWLAIVHPTGEVQTAQVTKLAAGRAVWTPPGQPAFCSLASLSAWCAGSGSCRR
jgi:hypothetical protein